MLSFLSEASKKDLLQKLQQFQADDASLYQAEPEENDEKQSDTVASLEERFADINLGKLWHVQKHWKHRVSDGMLLSNIKYL